ncbi:MAG: RluA family pseudouridine synthase [Acidobacteriota bacterium]
MSAHNSGTAHDDAPHGETDWTIDDDDPAIGTRLDRALAARLDVARSRVQRWIDGGAVTVNAGAARASAKLAAGDRVAIDDDAVARLEPEVGLAPDDGPLTVLHADDDLLLVDKPSDLVIHPGAGVRAGTLVHRLLHRAPDLASTPGIGGALRPGIVHRLDRDTTGILVVARSARAHRALSDAFAARTIGKRYLALVYGTPTPEVGRIEEPIGRHLRDRTRYAVRANGRAARTDYRVRARTADGALSLLEIALHTGRTHQIRVHLKAIGHPLLGDPVYGEARWRALPPTLRAAARDAPRPTLHAWTLAFAHPADGRPVRARAAVPADLRALWTALADADDPWPTAIGAHVDA